MAKAKILVVDDEVSIQKPMKMILQKEGMEVSSALTGKEALEKISSQSFDLIILDIMLPDIDGFDILQKIRSEGVVTPVLCLSGKEEEYTKIMGLGMGADDYMTKPFSVPFLISKVRAILRRASIYSNVPSAELRSGPFVISLKSFTAYKNDCELSLTSKELALLKLFIEHEGQVFSKEQLYTQVWNNTPIDDNTIMVYIKRLRDKIEDDPSNPQYLKTIWGIGYKFN